jgi:hypothetical protein
MTRRAEVPLARVVAEEAVLVLAFLVLLFARPGGSMFDLLLAAIPLVLVFRIATLHFPTRVVLSESHIAFSAYGISHTFAWADVTRLRVRRFLVKDRVLVRVSPAPAFRGRYWLTRQMHGFDDLVEELEARAS